MIRFGLLGCGKIAQRHASLLGGGHVPGACLSAVCDLDAGRARQFAQEFGVQPYPSADAMMRGSAVDAVTVLTPSGAHAADVVSLAPYGKHLVVEKPMALTLEDADRMIAACDRHQALYRQAEPLQSAGPQVARGARRGPLRQDRDGHDARALVPAAELLRSGCLARHLGL